MKRTTSIIYNIAVLVAIWGALGFPLYIFAQTAPPPPSTIPTPPELEGLVPPGIELPPDVWEFINKLVQEQLKKEGDLKKNREEATRKALEEIERQKIQAAIPEIELTLDRNDLKPGSKVRASVRVTKNTRAVRLNESTITWYHNTKKMSSGNGNTSYRFTLGELGTSENIRVVIVSQKGETFEVLKTVRPARIYLTWGADAYTPPWYRGKALPPPGAPIKIVAVPDFRIGTSILPSQDIIYQWLINDAPQSNGSSVNGKGKNTLSFNAGTSANVEYKITVQGRDSRSRIVHEESVMVRAHQPELLFYERDPALGLKYWHALTEASATPGKDFVMQFEPFNLRNADLDDLFYSWRVNGSKLANQNPQSRIFRLSSEEGSSGRQSVNVSYENPKNIFMRGSGQVTVNVGR